jgi:3-oxoacyl-[acyl-carrier-protein] synthase III
MLLPAWVRGEGRAMLPAQNSMRFQNTRIAAMAHALAPDIVSSEQLEQRLAPIYERFRLRVGRLELMSGIRERRFWPKGTRPSAAASLAAEAALEKADFDRARIGCLIHASVCRDFLEPATASVVHQSLGLAPSCTVFDLSNACLGVANGMALVAGMLERGEIEAGLVVAGEDGRPLIDETIRELLLEENQTKANLKAAFASLTIGSGAAAVLLVRADADQPGQRLIGCSTLAASEHSALCQGDHASGGSGLLMQTDSEALLHAGNQLAGRTFELFLEQLDWTRESIERVITHQVGTAHRRLLFETVGLDPKLDFPTVETMGNIGSVSLPLSFSMAQDANWIKPGQRVAMLGIGSGLNCMMLGLDW